jgi:hypothetical protein
MNATDIDTRITDEGRIALAPLIHVHELVKAGPVMQDENVKVTAALPLEGGRTEQDRREPVPGRGRGGSERP